MKIRNLVGDLSARLIETAALDEWAGVAFYVGSPTWASWASRASPFTKCYGKIVRVNRTVGQQAEYSCQRAFSASLYGPSLPHDDTKHLDLSHNGRSER